MKKLTVILGILLMGLTACTGKQNEAQSEEAKKSRVKTEVLKSKDIEQTREFTGTVESFLQNDICPSMPVRIDRILVEVGDKVRKGQLLVEMDMSQRNQTEIQLANMKIEYKRISELYKAGGASQQQVDQIKAQLDVMETTQKNLLENTQLRSPIDGVITGRYYHPGEMFSMSPTKSGKAAILTVMELAPLKVLINVSEEYFPRVKNGMPVKVASDIYPGENFNGRVHLIYPTIDPSTRTFPVEVSIPNANQKIRPGMFSRVTVNFGSMNRVIVPDLAVVKQMGTNDKYVYVVENGVAHKTKVLLGQQLGREYEVLEGLEKGQQVIIAGHTRLGDKAPVEIVK